MKKILIIEDDESICKELSVLLANAGYEAMILKDFEHALKECLSAQADLILLDIHIPCINGQLLLQNIRKESNVPIIMVTSSNSEVDEVLSMSYGADDYVTKPYNPTILLLRINAIFKRLHQVSDTLTYRDMQIHIQKGIIEKEKKQILLTKNEMLIFSYLVNHQNQMVTRDDLMTLLWNSNEFINDNALTVNISRLRNKLRVIGCEDAIETRKGYGYILL